MVFRRGSDRGIEEWNVIKNKLKINFAVNDHQSLYGT